MSKIISFDVYNIIGWGIKLSAFSIGVIIAKYVFHVTDIGVLCSLCLALGYCVKGIIDDNKKIKNETM